MSLQLDRQPSAAKSPVRTGAQLRQRAHQQVLSQPIQRPLQGAAARIQTTAPGAGLLRTLLCLGPGRFALSQPILVLLQLAQHIHRFLWHTASGLDTWKLLRLAVQCRKRGVPLPSSTVQRLPSVRTFSMAARRSLRRAFSACSCFACCFPAASPPLWLTSDMATFSRFGMMPEGCWPGCFRGGLPSGTSSKPSESSPCRAASLPSSTSAASTPGRTAQRSEQTTTTGVACIQVLHMRRCWGVKPLKASGGS